MDYYSNSSSWSCREINWFVESNGNSRSKGNPKENYPNVNNNSKTPNNELIKNLVGEIWEVTDPNTGLKELFLKQTVPPFHMIPLSDFEEDKNKSVPLEKNY